MNISGQLFFIWLCKRLMLKIDSFQTNVNGLHSRLKNWIKRFNGVASKYLDNYLVWFLFVDSHSNESTKHNIKEFLLTSFIFEMTETYKSLRLSRFAVE